MTTLGKTVALGSRETAWSYLGRLAALYDVPVLEFGLELGLPFSKVIAGDHQTIETLATLAGADFPLLQAWTPSATAPRTHILNGHSYHAKGLKQTTIRGCPVCLREDAQGNPKRPWNAMFIRGHWLARPNSVCLAHAHPLIPLWKDSAVQSRYSTMSKLSALSDQIISGALDVPLREPRGFDRWFEQRLAGGAGNGWLDGFSLFPAAHFCELLGRAVLSYKIPKSQKLHAEHAWWSFDAGYVFASKGEAAVRSALSELQQLIPGENLGPKGKFGDLYDRLANDLLSEEYWPFRKLLRDHIAETWPLGPGDDLMGEPVRKRRLHSVTSAAREVGMDSRRMRKLLSEAGFVRPTGSDQTDPWDLIEADEIAPFLEGLRHFVSAADLQKMLNLSRSQFDLLRRDGYLQPALDGPDHKPLWDIRAVRLFFDDLMANGVLVYPQHPDWFHIAAAAQRLKVRPGEILGLAVGKAPDWLGKLAGKDGYEAFAVNILAVGKLLHRGPVAGMSVEAFAKSFGLKPRAAMILVRGGHVPSVMERNPKTGQHQPLLTPASITAFQKSFVPLRTLARQLGRSWQAVLRDLEAANVAPFLPEGHDIGSVYEWSVLERNGYCRPGS